MQSSIDSKLHLANSLRASKLTYRKDKKTIEPKLKNLHYGAAKRKSNWTDKSMMMHVLMKTLIIFAIDWALSEFLIIRSIRRYEYLLASTVGKSLSKLAHGYS